MNTLTLRRLTALEGEELPKYRLSFLLDAEDFEIIRTESAIAEFLRQFEDAETDSTKSLEERLTLVTAKIGNRLWDYPSAIEFVEQTLPVNSFARAHSRQLTEKVAKLVDMTENFESRFVSLESKMQEILMRLGELSREKTATEIRVPDFPHQVSSDDGPSESTIHGKEQSVVPTAADILKMDRKIASVASLSELVLGNKVTDEDHRSLSNDSSGEDDDDAPHVAPVDENDKKNMDEYESIVNCPMDEVIRNLQSVEEFSLHYQDECNELLKLIQPTEASLTHRLSSFALIRGHARVAINSSVFEYGLQEIGCNLPSDPMLISVLLSKNNFPNWYLSLCERLTAVADGSEESWVEGMEASMPPGTLPYTHKVSHVEQVSDENGFLVTCTIDSVKVKISSNRRTDLCMLAFFEEVAGLVGKNNLFKKTLLLIRSWWTYEASSYLNKDVSAYLPSSVIAVMVCALFNRYYHRINSPLQALCMFISEYCGYQESVHVITLQGLTKFDPHSRDALKLIPPQPEHLISWELTEKYWQLFNSGSTAGGSTPGTPSYQQQPFGWDNPSNSNMNPKAQFNPFATTSFVAFQRTGFRVLHPFTHKSMISDRITPRRMNFILEAFKMGAHKLAKFLSVNNLAAGLEKTIFPVTVKKFQAHYADALLKNPNFTMGRPLLESPHVTHAVERIWQNILYCNFVMEAVVTESAILTASIENLSIRGPLPVGEVGKMLTEICGLPQLSLNLKEKFGGLKKFLEKFPEVFVFSNDHPFNPHLLLRSKLTPEHQGVIYRGVVPMQVMTAYKKGGGMSKKGAAATARAGLPPTAGVGTGGSPFLPSQQPPSATVPDRQAALFAFDQPSPNSAAYGRTAPPSGYSRETNTGSVVGFSRQQPQLPSAQVHYGGGRGNVNELSGYRNRDLVPAGSGYGPQSGRYYGGRDATMSQGQSYGGRGGNASFPDMAAYGGQYKPSYGDRDNRFDALGHDHRGGNYTSAGGRGSMYGGGPSHQQHDGYSQQRQPQQAQGDPWQQQSHYDTYDPNNGGSYLGGGVASGAVFHDLPGDAGLNATSASSHFLVAPPSPGSASTRSNETDLRKHFGN